MDKKVVYVILIIIAFMIIWFGNKVAVKTKEQPVSREINQEKQNINNEKSVMSGFAQNIPFAVNNSPGITIIKKPSFDKRVSFITEQADSAKTENGEGLDNIIGKNQGAKNAYVSSGKNQHADGEGRNVSSANSSPGVTKLNKRPTQEESREMNARGIILY